MLRASSWNRGKKRANRGTNTVNSVPRTSDDVIHFPGTGSALVAVIDVIKILRLDCVRSLFLRHRRRAASEKRFEKTAEKRRSMARQSDIGPVGTLDGFREYEASDRNRILRTESQRRESRYDGLPTSLSSNLGVEFNEKLQISYQIA
ncbi:hypothetical protein KM043_004353 [Ampulex compressa]|nr:hypothetical protein KM043_004353 [Ampulex compressa]